MTTKNLLFSFEDLSTKNKAAKDVARYFARAGANVVQTDIDPKVKRASGVTYREMNLTFADSQQVTLRIKQTGDVYDVLLNGTKIPIKNQDDHVKAIGEIVQKMDAGRTKFQAKLAKAAVKPPPGIKTAAPKLEQVLTEKRDALKEAVQATKEEIAKVLGLPEYPAPA